MVQPIPTADTANTPTARAAVREHALAALTDQIHTDGETVKATVLHGLYRQHPTVALEDILELTVSIPTPEGDSLSESVDAVLDEALEQYGTWQAAESHSDAARASIPATEDY